MKSNSFRLPSKATAVLLLCTGLVASHPLALWAEDGVTTVQAVQQQQVIVKGTVSDAMGPVIGANVIEKGNRGNGTITAVSYTQLGDVYKRQELLLILMETSRSK